MLRLIVWGPLLENEGIKGEVMLMVLDLNIVAVGDL